MLHHLLSITMFTILLFSSLILKVMSRGLPPAYGLDLYNGGEIQLLYRVKKGGDVCPFYQSTDDGNNLMMYKDGDQWVIKLYLESTRDDNQCAQQTCEKMVECVNSKETFTLQYTLNEERPKMDGWLDATDNNAETTLDLYKLDECTSYRDFYIVGSSTNQKFKMSMDESGIGSCLRTAGRIIGGVGGAKKTIIVSTETIAQGTHGEIFHCAYANIQGLDGVDVIMNKNYDDTNARVTILGNNCRSAPQRTVSIDEAWNDDETTTISATTTTTTENGGEAGGRTGLDDDDDTSTTIGAGVGGGVVLLIVITVAVVMCLKWKRTRDKRVTVDRNIEYGAQEYYDLRDTNVVDSNEAYNDYFDYDYGQ